MKVLDLFSGIGGFSLGLERAGMETIAFCEIEEYPRKILKKHWPDVPVFEDVRKLDANIINRTGTQRVDIICGGFPCQDVSVAGKQAGIKGSRSGLWQEYKRLIKELRPNYAIIENVGNLRSNGLTTVLQDLWSLGYDAEWHIIPASAVGGVHQRERLWIIAYPIDKGLQEPVLKWEAISSSIKTEKPGSFESGIFSWMRAYSHSCDIRKSDDVSEPVDRIKALGNAVVPQIPEMIGRAIMEIENNKDEK